MYDDYAPIIWAQCKHKHEGLQGYCAYIRVPTIHKEIQDAGDRGPDDPEIPIVLVLVETCLKMTKATTSYRPFLKATLPLPPLACLCNNVKAIGLL